MGDRRRECLAITAGLAARAMQTNGTEREALARLARRYWNGAKEARAGS